MGSLDNHFMSPRNPTVGDGRRSYRVFCNRLYGCPQPGCLKLLLTIRIDLDLPRGLVIVRECPRKKSILCEFRVDELLPPSGEG
jgi:hypothetical protein